MSLATCIDFPPFQLNVTDEQLWRITAQGAEAIRLRPKTFAVLRYLLERNQQLVTKHQLFEALWPGTWVTDSALKSCVRELREVLNDQVQTPRFIETVHRRGYRFIAPVSTQPVSSSRFQVPRVQVRDASPRLGTLSVEYGTSLVGREAELSQLHRWFGHALNGERQLVFITGEPGIGKTTMADAFLQGLESSVQRLASERQAPAVTAQTPGPRRQTLDARPWIGRGQCVEHYGAGEPYRPIFEALGRLCRGPEAQSLIDILSQHAPTWLAQMPSLLTAAALERLQHKVQGTTRARMLREMAEALEEVAKDRPLILVLEDLHWSDHSTLELLALLARRREYACMMVLVTYRPADVVVNGHPLGKVCDELQLHGYSQTLPLSFLTRLETETYLARRFPENVFPRKLTDLIHQRTEGNPLFMVSMVDDLVQRSRIIQSDGRWTLLSSSEKELTIPESLIHTLARQIEDLDDIEQQILETASVIGSEFSSTAIAAALAEDVEKIEKACDALVRQGRFLQACEPAEWSDEATAGYRFVHALYRDMLYGRIAVSKRIRLHGRIGACQETTYAERAKEMASELALHFECGREYPRAVYYHQKAAENALRRSAHHEALGHLDAGLQLLKKLPASEERDERELALYMTRAAPLGMVHGYGSPAVEEAYARARTLAQRVNQTPRLFPALAGLASVAHMRGRLREAHTLEEQLLRLAHSVANKTFCVWAHVLHGVTRYNRGQFTSARVQLETGLQSYDLRQHNPRASGGREDPGILGLTTLASILWLLGYPHQAQQTLHSARSVAEQSADPLSRAMVLGQTAVLHQRRREGRAALDAADAFLTLSQEQGFSFRAATGLIYRGWALVECGKGSEGIEQIRTGLAVVEESGAILARPYYLALLSEAYANAGRVEEALHVLKNAFTFMKASDERFYEAELWRLKGEFLLKGISGQSRGSREKSTNP